MQLSIDQIKAIEDGQPVPVLIDHTPCVVVRQDVYEQIRTLIDHDELRQIFARSVESSDWNDPEMDVYNNYEKS